MTPTSSHRHGLRTRARQELTRLRFRNSSRATPPPLVSYDSDVRYRALFEQSNDAVFILDLGGRHLQANRRACEMLGYTLEEIVGLSSRDLVVPEQYEQSLNVIQRLLAGESIRPYERTFRHRDGHHIPTEINVEVVRDNSGNPLYIQSIVRDITTRKQAEDALRQSEERYRGAIEASQDAFYLMESVRNTVGEIVDFRIIHANDHAVAQMSLPRDTLVGGLICELFPINRTGGFFERYKRVVETGEPLSEEYRIPQGHAAPGWYHQKVVKVGDGVAIVNYDITERKEAEIQRQAFLEDMQALQTMHLELGEIEDLETLYQSMIEMPQQRLGIDRVGLFLVDPTASQLTGTYGVDPGGKVRDEHDYQEIITPDHWTQDILDAPDHTRFWDDAPIYNNGAVVGTGWKAAAALWSGGHVLGYLVTDNFVTQRQPRIYERELLSLLGSTFGHLIERQRGEDALRQSEEKYRLIAENTSDGIAIIDGASNRIVYASPTYDRLWGRAVGESINISAEHHYESIHPDDRDEVNHLIKETVAQESATLLLTYRARHKQGHYFWKEDRVRIVRAPSQSSFYAYVISSDVTGRREMEDVLLHSEDRLRSILENMVDCVWSVDLTNNRLMYVNPVIECMTGWPPEAFFDNPTLWLEITHPEDRPTADSSDGNKNHSNEWTGRIIRRDGEVRWLTIRNWLVKDKQGQPVRAEGIANDITQRKLAQQREIDLTLEKERRRLLGTFIQNTSHEFRTPLATISSGTYLMTRTDDPERRKQKAAQIEDQVKRITRLIDNLILMARVENGDEHETKPVDIGALVRAACQKAANACSKQHRLHCDIDSTRLTVHGNTDQLTEAFQQIMHNACRYTPEGGIISIKLWSEARRVWVEVKDSGPGMDEEALVHIFDTLWRQDNAHSTPGLGLGLPIARRVIERHAGKIIVTSEVGQGTTLLVTLPLADAIG